MENSNETPVSSSDVRRQPLAECNKYLESMRKANRKYRENNKEKYNEYHKNYYHKNKTNEEYAQKQREKALKSYYKRKMEKQEKLLTV